MKHAWIAAHLSKWISQAMQPLVFLFDQKVQSRLCPKEVVLFSHLTMGFVRGRPVAWRGLVKEGGRKGDKGEQETEQSANKVIKLTDTETTAERRVFCSGSALSSFVYTVDWYVIMSLFLSWCWIHLCLLPTGIDLHFVFLFYRHRMWLFCVQPPNTGLS